MRLWQFLVTNCHSLWHNTIYYGVSLTKNLKVTLQTSTCVHSSSPCDIHCYNPSIIGQDLQWLRLPKLFMSYQNNRTWSTITALLLPVPWSPYAQVRSRTNNGLTFSLQSPNRRIWNQAFIHSLHNKFIRSKRYFPIILELELINVAPKPQILRNPKKRENCEKAE